MKRSAGKAIGLVLAIIVFVALLPLHRLLLPDDADWTTLAAVGVFAFGFVGLLSAALDRQSTPSTVRSAGIGVVLVSLGVALAISDHGAWRAIPMALLLALGIWAVADHQDEARPDDRTKAGRASLEE